MSKRVCSSCKVEVALGAHVCANCGIPLVASADEIESNDGKVEEVNDVTFDHEVLQSKKPVLVDFWAVWCGPCKAIAPIVDSVAAKYRDTLKVVKVNVDQNPATPSRYEVRGIPALVFFKEGKRADQIVGYVEQEVIEEKVRRLLA